MQQTYLINRRQPKLLLFFTGWGMDATPFAHYRPQECDLLIGYDYRTLHFDYEQLRGYDHIHLVAWSMGVWAASHVMANGQWPILSSTAINGTPYPVDEARGIPPPLFQATCEGLTEASLLKFQRRMCGSNEAFGRFRSVAPCRPVAELKEELVAIGLQQQRLAPPSFTWQQAVIGGNDRIFPPQHQQTAWQGSCPSIRLGDEAHYDETLFKLHLNV